jgi:hypothetical protein
VIRVGPVILLALALGVVHALACGFFPPQALAAWLFGAHLSTKLLAAAGAAVAYATLRPGDYMRRFWGTLGLGYLLLAISEDGLARLLGGGSTTTTWVGALALVAGNVLSVAASATIAYTFRSAGLGDAFGWRRVAAMLVTAAAAAGLVWVNLLGDVRAALADGGLPAWASAFSYACDALTFALLVPVLLYALRLGGAKLAGPWLAFSASTTCWLFFAAIEHLPVDTRLAAEALRITATLLAGAAGLLQRELVVEARTRAARLIPAA